MTEALLTAAITAIEEKWILNEELREVLSIIPYEDL